MTVKKIWAIPDFLVNVTASKYRVAVSLLWAILGNQGIVQHLAENRGLVNTGFGLWNWTVCAKYTFHKL